jgi:hypothetical protein
MVVLKMPQKLKVESADDLVTFLSEGFGDQRSLCQHISETAEAQLLGMIAKELNDKCGLDLAMDFSTDLCLSEEGKSDDVKDRIVERIIYVGSSHGVRTVETFDMNVFDPKDLCDRGWNLSESAVERKVKDLAEVVAEGDKAHTTVVYHIFDNLTYACQKDRERPARPVKGNNGVYHMEGKLVIAGKEEMRRLVSMAILVFRAGGLCRKIVISPASRYKHAQKPLHQHPGKRRC